jgi:hypothetical protein
VSRKDLLISVVSIFREVGVEMRGQHTSEGVAKKAKPLRTVANCISTVAIDCSKTSRLIEEQHELCKMWLRKYKVTSYFICVCSLVTTRRREAFFYVWKKGHNLHPASFRLNKLVN